MIGRMMIVMVTLCATLPFAVEPPAHAASRKNPTDEGRLLVLNKTDGTMMVFDLPTHRLEGTLRVGSEPHEVVANPKGTKAYITDVGEGGLAVVDLQAFVLLKTIRSEGFDRPHGLHVSRDGRRLLLTSEGSHRLYLIDAERDVVDRAMTTTQSGAHMLTVGKGGSRMFVTNRGSGSVTTGNAYNLSIRAHVPVGEAPEGLAIDPKGRWLLVALQKSDEVALLDPRTLEERHRLPVGRRPIRIAVTPDGSTALVSNRGSGDVTVLDLNILAVRGTIEVGERPGGLAIGGTGQRAWVCNNGSNDVAVLSISDLRVVDRIPAGHEPDGIAFVAASPVARGKGRGGADRGGNKKEGERE